MVNEALDFTVNKLMLGDNLKILKTLDAESVDLLKINDAVEKLS